MDTKNNINIESYNAIVDDWASIRNSKEVNQCIKDFCKLLPSKASVLDVGCGTGKPIDVYLSDSKFKVVGIDISNKMIDFAKELNLENTIFINTDFLDYKNDDKFDAIIAFDSIWHIDLDDQLSIYKKFASLLVDDGYLLFTHGIRHETILGKMFSHSFSYSALAKDELKKALMDNNFSIISWYENYEEKTTGTRDLLVIAQKRTSHLK
ncbi:MAG TPA: class I SAM-dependent methyltransferase [Bacilli bacterium]|nr:class I SAM-dependent methyltransferase [Bacilli bacterium]